ncbi:MAG TPA: GNAT family N-acetyltransferase, partial [Alteromonas sp.]|nr:GNAT family N-acetyltransferase [Alteromonas sp.]
MRINPDKLSLVTPGMAWQVSYNSYIEELGEEERYPFPMDFDHHDFAAMLQKIADFAAGVNLPDGYVASTTLWLVSGDDLLAV